MKNIIFLFFMFFSVSVINAQEKKWGIEYGAYERVKDGSMKIEDATYLTFFRVKKIPNDLKDFYNVKEMRLASCKELKNVDNLCCLDNLERLQIDNCRFGSIKIDSKLFEKLPRLKTLEINSSTINTISHKISNLKALTNLTISNNGEGENVFIDYTFLEDLPSLEELDLGTNLNICYRNLKNLKNLKRIALSDSNENSHILFEIFGSLTGLEEISLTGAQIARIPFKKMPKLKKLKITTNKSIENFGSLIGIETLEELHIGNYIANDDSELILKKLSSVNPKLKIFKTYNQLSEDTDY
ncbi:leucine-rich repeat domain-containing protein [Flavobacterium turcicum]|uniref:Leucine-rich repeat domain-containing protein n=1 Tax=Flavobacterium turcicum TaxID=2764718 RepID=A0ABR7JCE5_9FLAO|nr:leucine-rich repeat domain-containing protein [Flavobacterium turcicum]MBC5861834.1 hypothetical protein [Flavobacterium turcicum]NHL00565.1 leucine-rich repeat domain-containing protein [Flavobacterium turcicum]